MAMNTDNKILFDPGREDRSNEKVSHKRKNSNVWLIVVAIIVAATVAGVNVLTYYSNKNSQKKNDLTSQSLIEYTAEKKPLDQKIVRSGKLKFRGKENYEYVSGIKFDKVFFKNGDDIKEGEVIGYVDTVSLAAAMENTRKMIRDLDKELKTEIKDNSNNKIKSPVDGRVKEIYAQKSDIVSEIVYDKGALMILSVDGKMAADIKTDVNIGVGTAVKGTLADGNELKGKVAAYSEGLMKVTFSDKIPNVGDKIKVSYKGEDLGESELYINCPLRITSFEGKISEVKVKQGKNVEKGDTLFTLTEDVNSDRYNTLMSQRADLQDDLKDMLDLYLAGVIKADASGIIDGLDEDLYEGEEELPSKNKAPAMIPDDDTKSSDAEPTEPKDTEPTIPSDVTEPTMPSDPSIPSDITMPTDIPSMPSIPPGMDPAQYYALINGGVLPGDGQLPQDMGADETHEPVQYINEKKDLYSIRESSDFEMVVDVFDKDVIRMEEGMPCTIWTTALGDESFEGKISNIDTKGKLSGKKAVYKVTVTTPRIQDIHEGMSAKVELPLESEPVITVPIAAVEQIDNKTYVYTSKDEETNELSGLREVTLGQSDAEYAEVLTGLAEGDKVFYMYYDTIDYTKITNGVDTNSLYF